MNRFLRIACSITTIALLAGWAQKETEKTAYFGKVTTRQGNVLKLTNIKVGRDRNSAIIKQIPVYEVPKEHAAPALISGTNNQEIILTVEPETQLYKKFIDLNEIQSVTVPEPSIIWTYRKPGQYGKTEYMEIVFGKPENEEHYLIDRRMKLFGDAIQTEAQKELSEENEPELKKRKTEFPVKGPEESEVPLPAIQKVEVEGYYIKQEGGAIQQMPACATRELAKPDVKPAQK